MSHAVHYPHQSNSGGVHEGDYESCESCRAAHMARAREMAKAYAQTARAAERTQMNADEIETVRRVNVLLKREKPARRGESLWAAIALGACIGSAVGVVAGAIIYVVSWLFF